MPFQFKLTLGMPHLGRNNLSESALFKTLGNHRWHHLEELGGTPSSSIRDDEGTRLYPTFYFLEINAPITRPLSTYGENQVMVFHPTLAHHGRSHLDGRYRIGGEPDSWIRLSNVFIYQLAGPSKLAVSFPSNVDFTGIQELEVAPDSLQLCRAARQTKRFLAPNVEDLPLFEGERTYTYALDADRDLNGAGLVYFANFVSFLDRAEREILGGLPSPVPRLVLDRRSTYRRMVGYYGNAEASDRLIISLRASYRIERGFGPERLDLAFDHRIVRASDNKEILISSCRKVAPYADDTEAATWVSELAASA